MKTALVTGGTGFVGANLARRLLADGHETHLLVRPSSDPWRIEEIKDDARIWPVDLRDQQSVERVVQEVRPEWIFHLAAYGAYPSQTEPGLMVQTNIAGTMNIVQECMDVGFETFVNTGSSSEYGFKTKAAKETDRLDPNSHYSWTKAAATHFCQYTARSGGANILTLRLYSVFGPFEEPTRLMPSLILRGMKGELPPLASRNIARDYVYVDDVTDAYVKAAQTPSQELGAIYNVGTGVQTALEEVVEIARRQLQIKAEARWETMPNRAWDTAVWLSDTRKIGQELGWQPSNTFGEGVTLLTEWFAGRPELVRFYESRCS